MFKSLNGVLTQKNKNVRSTTHLTGPSAGGMYTQYMGKHRNDAKSLFENCRYNIMKKRKWQPESDRLPLQMVVAPLVRRENPAVYSVEENDISQISENSFGYYQRQRNGKHLHVPTQKKRRKVSERSFISHSQRILDKMKKQYVPNNVNWRNNYSAEKSNVETAGNPFSNRTGSSNLKHCGKNLTIPASEIEQMLQTPLQNIRLSSPDEKMCLNNEYRSSNNLLDSDESPSVPDENESFYENVLIDVNKEDYEPLTSVDGGCESTCHNCTCERFPNAQEQFHWNPVVVNTQVGDIHKQFDQELDRLLRVNSKNSYNCNNAAYFDEFSESDGSVLNSDSTNSVNSNHSSNVKNCFKQCEEYWSREGQVCLKTTYEESVCLTFLTEPEGVTSSACDSDCVLSFPEE